MSFIEFMKFFNNVVSQEEDTPPASESSEDIPVTIPSKRRRTVPPTPKLPFASPRIFSDVAVNPEAQKNRPKGPGPPPPKPPRLFLPPLSESLDQPEDVTGKIYHKIEIRKGLGLVDYPTETTPQSSGQATGEVSEAEQTQEPIYAEMIINNKEGKKNISFIELQMKLETTSTERLISSELEVSFNCFE
ncbi:hypothetical protein RF11_11472 [Thelohanellus kitauei]|uniref:Uncharacterized protein n=1 Tax=Thelohanellus kitauei TaxID=669202 RepID=A0A0C2M8E4_THEKT|nr:hypothetical protein RF11_11472 [Thelohanellus kitauei]